MNPIQFIFGAAGHAREVWDKRKEAGGSLKEAARREAEMVSRHHLKSSALTVGSRFIKDSRAMAARRGDYAMMMLYDLAHGLVSRHAAKAQHNQMTFELTKHVERGDTAHLSDKQLDHIAKNAEQFGGANAETIRAKAEAEKKARLDAKMKAKAQKAAENAAAAAQKNAESKAAAELANKQKMSEKEARREAARKQKEFAKSPEGIKQAALARQKAQLELMRSPEWKEMQRQKQEIKQQVKQATAAANKEQRKNQQQRAQRAPGPGRPRNVSEAVQQGKRKQGTITTVAPGGKTKMQGETPDWQNDYNAQGINIYTGKAARGAVRAELIASGKVKASVGSVARKARRRKPRSSGA